jgi:GntR family transcriptional regulator
MILRIDPDSPVPLYHQIAQALRASIETGELAPGDALQPMRQAAEQWGVNIHTVRHAYAALAREGLVKRSRVPRGTRIAPHSRGNTSRTEEIDVFLENIRQEAADRFGMGARSLAAALLGSAPVPDADLPTVYVVECSEWQCAAHAREITAQFRVLARTWPLGRESEPPDGPVVSTFFHYNDLRRMWPRRLGRIHYLIIYPDPALHERLSRTLRVIVCEYDEATAEVVEADLTALSVDRANWIDARITDDPAALLKPRRGPPVLFTPRVWAALPERSRAHPQALELRYVF